MQALSRRTTLSQKTVVRRASPPRNRSERWAIILAGGEGTRLRSMTRTISGDDRPKQFVPLIGSRTLLDQTRERVALSVPIQRTLLVLTRTHEEFYARTAQTLSRESFVVQPSNKGTAPAILYALLRVAAKSPRALVTLFPSDHYFADDEGFMADVDAAYEATVRNPEMITLLGITADAPEVEYGWIQPEQSILSTLPRSITRVAKFWEKPTLPVAQGLMQQGCLWNSFVMVGRVDALLEMISEALPDLFAKFARVVPTFGGPAEQGAVCELYSQIADVNFSHEVLAQRPGDLAVMRVGDVGWSDLGDPLRVLATLKRIGMQTNRAMPVA